MIINRIKLYQNHVTIAKRTVKFADLFRSERNEKQKKARHFITDFARQVVIIISLFVENVVGKERRERMLVKAVADY